MLRLSDAQLAALRRKRAGGQAREPGLPERTAEGLWLNLPMPPSKNRYWRHPGLDLQNERVAAEVIRVVSRGGGTDALKKWARRRLLGSHLLSREARAYKLIVAWEMRRLGIVRPMEGPLKVEVVLHFERRGRMDLSNRIDPLFDALQYAKVFVDDSQIDEFHVSRGVIKPQGMCRVRLSFATGEGRQDAQLAE